jgi:chromosome segregation ATPase
LKARLQASMEERASLSERAQLLEGERAKLEEQLASAKLDQLRPTQQIESQLKAEQMELQLKASEQELIDLKGIEKELRAAIEEVLQGICILSSV